MALSRGAVLSPLAGGAAALVLLVAPVASAEGPSEPCWGERSHLTGGWGGLREALSKRGIAPAARYTAGFWSNVRGGFQTGTRYEGFAEWSLAADLERLLGWKGTSFLMSWHSYHGGQPSEDLVGTFSTQAVSGHEAARAVRFSEILLRKTWRDGRFAFKAGQLATDADFLVSDNAATLLNATFGFVDLGHARQFAPFYPLAAPGAYARARTADSRWEARGGVYTADVGEDRSGNFGFGWSFDNGATLIGELRSRRSPFGRTGDYAFGAIGTTAHLESFDGGGRANGTYQLYAVIDQQLRSGTSSRPGLGLFVRAIGAPQTDRNPVRWHVGLGLRASHPLPGREHDALALGFAYLSFSESYVASQLASGMRVSRRQSVLEITYRLQVVGWLSLQPDVQFFFDPSLSRRDATALGLRAVVEL